MKGGFIIYNIKEIVFIDKSSNCFWNKHFIVIIKKVKKDYFGFILSSKIPTIKYNCNEYLKKSNRNKLNKNSIIKCDSLIKITDKDIKFKIGSITECEYYRIQDTYNKYLIEHKKRR